MMGGSRDQRELVDALLDPACYPHPVDRVERLETHISIILLAGEYAYKIKKPIDLGFLDFTSLANRRYYCAEEIRVNARLAPTLYLGIVPITVVGGRVHVGNSGEPVEFAVRMRRFPQEALLSRIAAEGPLPERLVDRLADTVAEFHDGLEPAFADEGYGDPVGIRRRALENMEAVRELELPEETAMQRDALDRWFRERSARLAPVFAERAAGGHVRECHGDLHLDNVLWWEGRVLPFDAVEFAADLRWIDTASDLAFLLMDLRFRRQDAASNRLLGRYLEQTGDYGALRVLPFYIAYRALVRGKIEAVRISQAEDETARQRARERLARYLALASDQRRVSPPAVVITFGLSGAGKSTLAQTLVEHRGLIRLRSDVERKRLFGLRPDARTDSGVDEGLYTPEATERTYQRLADLTAGVVRSGYTPVVDASFLSRAERRRFRQLADSLGAELRILAAEADEAELRRRLRARATGKGDPSEADERVLDRQLESWEPLTPDERACILETDPDRSAGSRRTS